MTAPRWPGSPDCPWTATRRSPPSRATRTYPATSPPRWRCRSCAGSTRSMAASAPSPSSRSPTCSASCSPTVCCVAPATPSTRPKAAVRCCVRRACRRWWRPPSRRWRAAACTTPSRAASSATPRNATGACPTTRRCSRTTPGSSCSIWTPPCSPRTTTSASPVSTGALPRAPSTTSSRRSGGDDVPAFGGSQDADEKYYLLDAGGRAELPAPFVDPTVYVDWNALAARALLRAAPILGRPELADRALQLLDHLCAVARRGDAMAHWVRPDGTAGDGAPLLGDQATMAAAFLDAYELTGDRQLAAARPQPRALDVRAPVRAGRPPPRQARRAGRERRPAGAAGAGARRERRDGRGPAAPRGVHRRGAPPRAGARDPRRLGDALRAVRRGRLGLRAGAPALPRAAEPHRRSSDAATTTRRGGCTPPRWSPASPLRTVQWLDPSDATDAARLAEAGLPAEAAAAAYVCRGQACSLFRP